MSRPPSKQIRFYGSFWDVVHPDGYEYTLADTNDALIVQKYFRVHGSLFMFLKDAYGLTDRGQVFLNPDFPPNEHTIRSMMMGSTSKELEEIGVKAIIRPHTPKKGVSYYQLNMGRFNVKSKYMRIPMPMMHGIVCGKIKRWSFLKVRPIHNDKDTSVTYRYRENNLKLMVDSDVIRAFENPRLSWKMTVRDKEIAYDEGLASLHGYV